MIGSLFSGIGGFELGFAWAGLGPVSWQVEIDPFCRGVLAMHWPHAKRFEDVRSVGKANLAPVDVICGGFPCQDISSAGKGEGIEGARSSLWYEYRRIVEELRPRVVVVENVAALAARGLDVVVAGLDALGYCVHGRIIAAADVGAPHRRERLFLVAHTAGEALADAGHDRRGERGAGHDDDRRDASGNDADGRDPHVADADGQRVRNERQRLSGRRARGVRARGHAVALDDRASGGRHAQSGLGRNADGLPDRLDRWPSRPGDAPALWEPTRAVTRYSPSRAPRLHALGNAIVPQIVADEIAPMVRRFLE